MVLLFIVVGSQKKISSKKKKFPMCMYVYSLCIITKFKQIFENKIKICTIINKV